MRGMSWAWRGCQKASKNWAWKAAVRNVLGLQRPLTGMQELADLTQKLCKTISLFSDSSTLIDTTNATKAKIFLLIASVLFI